MVLRGKAPLTSARRCKLWGDLPASDDLVHDCGARKPRFAFLPATIRPRCSLPVGQSLHSRTGCICEGRSEEPVGPLLGELARVSEDDLNLGIPDLQACQHIGEPGTGNML